MRDEVSKVAQELSNGRFIGRVERIKIKFGLSHGKGKSKKKYSKKKKKGSKS